MNSRSDSRFAGQVLFISACAAIAILALSAGQVLVWWQNLILAWIWFGFLSVMIQVITDFSYIRLVPRTDAVLSYTISVIFGPLSLVRNLWDFQKKTRA